MTTTPTAGVSYVTRYNHTSETLNRQEFEKVLDWKVQDTLAETRLDCYDTFVHETHFVHNDWISRTYIRVNPADSSDNYSTNFVAPAEWFNA